MPNSSRVPPRDPGPLRFATELRDSGSGGAYIEFPFDAEEMFGTKGRLPVRLLVNGAPYRGSLVQYRGVRMVGIPKAVREQAGATAGTSVDVILELDTEERVVEVPTDLANALAADEEAARGWPRLSFTHQREYVQAILDAKREDTRAKRVALALEGARKKA